MSSLYTKYRPYKLSDVVGQDHVKQYFKNTVEQDKIGHAFLLTGIRGTGKTTLARILSLIVNCENGPAIDYDTDSRICQAIIKQQCPDVHEMDAASKSSIDDTRDIVAMSRNMPMMCRKRVFIVDEVHCLNNKAVSALLKTLEEPPQHCMFIMATTEPNNVLSTIRSRCQRLDLTRISDRDIANRLRYICEQEKIEEVEKTAIEQIAKSGNGSLRDAISNLEMVIGRSGGHLTTKQVSEALSSSGQEFYLTLLRHMYMGQYGEALGLVRKELSKGEEPEKILMMLLEFSHDMMLNRVTNDFNLFYISDGIKNSWIKAAQTIDEIILKQVNKILLSFSGAIRTSPKVDYLLDSAIIEIIDNIQKFKQMAKAN